MKKFVKKDLLSIDEVSSLLQHEFERYALVCDSTSPLLKCASLKDDVRYDVYPCVSSPTYQHCYSFEDFQHKHEDWFEEVKTSRDVFIAVISDVKLDFYYTDDNERFLISFDSNLTFN